MGKEVVDALGDDARLDRGAGTRPGVGSRTTSSKIDRPTRHSGAFDRQRARRASTASSFSSPSGSAPLKPAMQHGALVGGDGDAEEARRRGRRGRRGGGRRRRTSRPERRRGRACTTMRVDVVGVELAAADGEDVAVGQDREVAGAVVLAGEVEPGDAVGAEASRPSCRRRGSGRRRGRPSPRGLRRGRSRRGCSCRPAATTWYDSVTPGEHDVVGDAAVAERVVEHAVRATSGSAPG